MIFLVHLFNTFSRDLFMLYSSTIIGYREMQVLFQLPCTHERFHYQGQMCNANLFIICTKHAVLV